MRILIIALLLLLVMLSGCVTNTDYTGTYEGSKETVTLFADGTFSVQKTDEGYSGTYEIMDDKIYFKHPLVSYSLNIKDDTIYDDEGHILHKQ